MADDQSEVLDEPVAGFIVHGRVQGVGFRWWTSRTASAMGLHGTVRNRSDGTVEVRARGPAEELTRLAALLERGPRGARVERLERFDPGPVRVEGFEIEP